MPSKVFAALSVSVDGFITGRDPGAGRGLGNATTLFDWYFDGDTPSAVFDGFRLSGPSARVFDAEAARAGAVVVGRNTYDDSGWAEGGGPPPSAHTVAAAGPTSSRFPTTSASSSSTPSPRRA